MSAPIEREFTLKELVQMALGTSTMTPYSIKILCSVFNILLKKLNSQNETVKIGVPDAQCMKQIFHLAKTDKIAFDDSQIEIITENLNILDGIENSINEMEEKLENHFEEIRQSNITRRLIFDWHFWERYGGICDDTCSSCLVDNEISCKLLKNTDFVRKFMRRISTPLIDQMLIFEKKIELCEQKVIEIANYIENFRTQIELIYVCIKQIETLRFQIAESQLTFEETIEEVQQMLRAKLDKVHIPALKMYIKEHVGILEEKINLFHKSSDCPVPGSQFKDGTCLSCGVELTQKGTPWLKEKKIPPKCVCEEHLIGLALESLQQYEVKRADRSSYVRFSIIS